MRPREFQASWFLVAIATLPFSCITVCKSWFLYRIQVTSKEISLVTCLQNVSGDFKDKRWNTGAYECGFKLLLSCKLPKKNREGTYNVLHFFMEVFGTCDGLIKHQSKQNRPLFLWAEGCIKNNKFGSINEKVIHKHHHLCKKYQVIPVLVSFSFKLHAPLSEKHLQLI